MRDAELTRNVVTSRHQTSLV